MDIQDISATLIAYRDQAATQFQKVPGSAILLRYIKSSYQNDPVRSAIELCLILFAIRYLLAPKYSTQKQNYVKLTEKEIDELIDDWTPEPLVASLSDFEQEQIDKTPVIVGPQGTKVKLSTGRTVTNLAAYNFYNFASSQALADSAVSTLRTYGVGPCGPPGFYGTQDVHLDLEKNIAEFLGVQACIVYAQAFSTISSVIPAFCKRGDVIIADKRCNYAIQKGLQISRSTIRWYEHGDMEDLERQLIKVQREMRGRELTRRFIVTEAMFEDGGDIVDLAAIVSLKFKYKYRLILDESLSFGILGATGRGLTEMQDIPTTSIDALVGSLATTFAGGGGFCAGAQEIVQHQRISGTSYVFSAALPAMLATTASETIRLLRENPDHYLTPLRENIKTFHTTLLTKSEVLTITSSLLNPVVTITLNLRKQQQQQPTATTASALISTLASSSSSSTTTITNNSNSYSGGSSGSISPADEERLVQDVVDECLANGVLVSRIKRIAPPPGSRNEATWFGWQPTIGLRACVSTGLTRKECEKAAGVIRSAVVKVVGKRR